MFNKLICNSIKSKMIKFGQLNIFQNNNYNISLILLLTNLALLLILSYSNSTFLIGLSSFLQILLLISLRERLIKFFSIIIFCMYQVPFYIQIANFNSYNFKITLGNFYSNMSIIESLIIYKPIHMIISLFLLCLIMTEFLPKIKKKELFNLNNNILNFFIYSLLLFNFIIFVVKLIDLNNYGITNILSSGLYVKITTLPILGQLIKKIYYLNFLALSYFAYKKQLYNRLVIVIFLLVLFLSIIKISRFETIFLILLIFINIKKIKTRNILIFIMGLILPIFWHIFSQFRGYIYSSGTVNMFELFSSYNAYSIVDTYLILLSNIFGRISYIYEISTIYYLNIFSSVNYLNYFWQTLLPSFVTGSKEIFYANDFQTMIDLKLISSNYAFTNTAGLGLIGESYYFLHNNFWIIGLVYSLLFYLLISFTRNFEKNLKKAFYVYFLFLFVFKDTFIGASLDILFLFITIGLFNLIGNFNRLKLKI